VRPSAQAAPDAPAIDALLSRVKASAMRYPGAPAGFYPYPIHRSQGGPLRGRTGWRTMDTLEEVVSFASSGRVSKILMKKNGRPAIGMRPGGLTENAVLLFLQPKPS